MTKKFRSYFSKLGERIRYNYKKYKIAYYFILPTVIGMAIMHLAPILQGFYMAFLKLNNYTLSQYLGAPFVGFDNFYDILINPDSPMRIGILDSIRNTVVYAVIVTGGQIGFGMIVALMLNQDFKLRSLVRTLFLFSWIVPTYVTGILWGFMWQQSIGIINIILYDLFKFHVLARYINSGIQFLQLDRLVDFYNKVFVGSVIYVLKFFNINLFYGDRMAIQTSSILSKIIIIFVVAAVVYTFIGIVKSTMYNFKENGVSSGIKSLIVNFICMTLIGFFPVLAFLYPFGKLHKKIYARSNRWGVIIFSFVTLTVFLGVINVQLPLQLTTEYKLRWLTGGNTIWAIIIPTIWRYWPMSMLMLLAGLQNIPQSLYDAVKIDGANKWNAFWKITWPMLKPVWMILILFGMIYNVYSFNIVIMMFGNGAGFPGEWGDLMMTNIFRNSFMRWDFGVGAATSVLLLFVMIIAVNIWFKFYRKTEDSYF